MSCTFIFILVALSFWTSTAIRVTFESLDVGYIAREYNIAGEPEEFDYGSYLIDDIAVDIRKQLVYAVGENRLTVFKILPNKTLEFLHTEIFGEYYFQSVQTCKNFVTIAARQDDEAKEDRLIVLRGYNKRLGGNLARIHSIPIGFGPEHHVVTRNCKKVVIAVEFAGKIAVVHFRQSLSSTPVVLTLSFTAFANQQEQQRLEKEWFNLNLEFSNTFDGAMDPEWICLNKRETKAYVTMGNNNGVAVVDLRPGREHIKNLRGLGLKGWAEGAGNRGFDGSNSPQKAELKNAPIFSVYNPLQVSCQTVNKKDYIFLAGEGTGANTDALSDLSLEEDLPQELQQPGEFGDLRVLPLSPQTDPDMDGKVNKIVMVGSRSFAAVSGKTLKVLEDTGSTIELHTMNSVLFNNDPENSEVLLDDFDEKSTGRGSEPELVFTKQVCGGRYIVMVGGIAHPGILFVYTLDTHRLREGFVFQDQVDGYERKDSLFTDMELYNKRLLSLRHPKGLKFGRSRGNRITVVSGSTVTSSVELFDLHIDCKAMNPEGDH